MTTSKPGVVRYMAPELLNPSQFGFTQSDPSCESDIYSFAMTAYEVFSSYLVAPLANEHLPTTRSSRGSCHMVWGGRVLPPLISHAVTVHLVRTAPRPSAGYLTPSGTSFSVAGSSFRGPGWPLIYCVKRSMNLDGSERGKPQSLRMVNLSVM